MRAFQTVVAALAAVAVNGQLVTRSYGLGGLYGTGLSYGSGLYGASYGSGLYGAAYSPAISYGGGYGGGYGARYSTIAAAPAVSYGISAAPAISYAAAPAISYAAAPAISYAAAPAIATRAVSVAAPIATRTVSVAAAPAISYAAPAQAVNVGVIATAGAPAVRSHEIHTGSGRQAIRIEDFQAGDQVIRVHEGPQAGPEVAQVAVPGEQHHVRVIEHQSGPAHIERVVSRAQTQVIDLQKPGRPGARIIQVVKGQSPAPSIEFVSAGGSSHHVYYADDVNAGGAIGGGAIGGGFVRGGYGGGVIGGGYGGATTFATSYAPAVGGAVIAAAPAVQTIAAAPIAARTISVAAAPVATRTVSVAAAPAVSYGSYGSYGSYAPISYGTYGLGGFGYGGLGYSTGYNSYGSGGNVFLDAKKSASASAKKSA